MSVGPGASATLHSQSQTVFTTSLLNNGGDCHANGLLTLQSGVTRFVSPLQGVGQVRVAEAANLQFDGTFDPNPVVIAFDALTNTNQTSRTTHAFVTGAMVSALLAGSPSIPPTAIQNFGLLQIMPLARVALYRLLKTGVTESLDATANGQALSAGVVQSGGRFVIESGGELVLDTASASNGSSTSPAPASAPTTTPSPPQTTSTSSAFSEFGGDGIWNFGKLVLLSGKMR
jgi:hypothetical protein